MRQLIVSEFITLDGVVEAPGGEPSHPHTGWTIPYGTDQLYADKLRETLEAGSLLLGRRTYEGFAAAWPTHEGEFADKMNTMPKHVATRTLRQLTWNATALEGDVPTAVQALKQGEGGPILVVGSPSLVRTLLQHELVDELRLVVFPIAVGGGFGLFPAGRERLAFDLVELVRYESGATLQVYRPASAPSVAAGLAALRAALEG
ncbi:MAG: dihydrofolate reductase family protein [Dehalococcoidia bacterium]|nr:dihydrofolate reductase family protein [Dehalococcoidia bacterium]